MNTTTLLKRKTSVAAQAPVDIEAIGKRLAELRVLDRKLLAELIALEQGAGDKPLAVDPIGDIGLLVECMAGGDLANMASLPNPGPPPPPRPLQILQQRAAIEKAITKLTNDLSAAYEARAKANYERRGSEWRSLVHETAMLVCKLQSANRRRAQMAREIRAKTSMPLPGEFPNDLPICGKGYASDGPHAFLELAVRLGIVTEGEIARERGDAPERFKP